MYGGADPPVIRPAQPSRTLASADATRWVARVVSSAVVAAVAVAIAGTVSGRTGTIASLRGRKSLLWFVAAATTPRPISMSAYFWAPPARSTTPARDRL